MEGRTIEPTNGGTDTTHYRDAQLHLQSKLSASLTRKHSGSHVAMKIQIWARI